MKKLIHHWKTKIPLNFKEKVHKIEHANCAIDIEVVNFDKVKDKFLEILNIGEDVKIKSVDAITLDRKKHLCLIEMKGYSKSINKLNFTNEKISEMIPKIADSMQILISIFGYFAAKRSWYYTILHPKQLKIYTYLVIDYDYKDLHPIKLALQDRLNIKISARVQTPIQLINCEEFERLFTK